MCICHNLLPHPSIDGHLDYLYLLAIMDNVAVNVGVQFSVKTYVCIFLDIYLEVELLGPMVIICLIF